MSESVVGGLHCHESDAGVTGGVGVVVAVANGSTLGESMVWRYLSIHAVRHAPRPSGCTIAHPPDRTPPGYMTM